MFFNYCFLFSPPPSHPTPFSSTPTPTTTNDSELQPMGEKMASILVTIIRIKLASNNHKIWKNIHFFQPSPNPNIFSHVPWHLNSIWEPLITSVWSFKLYTPWKKIPYLSFFLLYPHCWPWCLAHNHCWEKEKQSQIAGNKPGLVLVSRPYLLWLNITKFMKLPSQTSYLCDHEGLRQKIRPLWAPSK